MPAWRRVLARESVDLLAEQIGMPRVTPVLFDVITEETSQIRMLSVVVRHVDGLIQVSP